MVLSPLEGIARRGDDPKSVVLKGHSTDRLMLYYPRDNSAEKLWDAFLVVKKANSGDPIAQHELGLRYLQGKDFSADTEKAAYWIGKAAAQKLLPAQYNYGLLLNNGWGVSWNPFDAYRHFRNAAFRGLVEAEYVYGLLLTDNLVVPRDYSEAYHWIKMAADSGFSPAADVINEFQMRGIMAKIQSGKKESKNQHKPASHNPAQKPSLRPVLLDFTNDSIPTPNDVMLLKEALQEEDESLKKLSDTIRSRQEEPLIDAKRIQMFSAAAEAGSPEALTMMGRLYERGIEVPRDVVLASVYYLRSVRMDSPWSPMLLWDLIHKPGYFRILRDSVDVGSAVAKFLWSGLVEIGFDDQLTEAQALSFLKEASAQGYVHAIVQLALSYYTGRWVGKDRQKASVLFYRAEELGSEEAKDRLCSIRLQEQTGNDDMGILIDTLQQSASRGSVLAEAMLGYCYQEGKGVPKNKPEAVRLYRHAAQRGSNVAFEALKKLYDELRPDDPVFRLDD